jgi:hypothetical protein
VVGVVQGRREPVEIGRNRRRSGAGERRHDVDSLTGAREKNCCHGGRG